MTRINTNVSSLTAQKSLARSNIALQQALTRLSTGLRINTGKDDPAGLIASEALRSDITSTSTAITNSQRANQVIATADSALGAVSGLLNDIRGLVTEAANKGAMSEDQIAANQLQIDSSLEALNRISQTTSFQGRRLLDGSLDFITTAGSIASIEDMQIDQANLGATGSIGVAVDITTAAAQASVTSTGFSAAANAKAVLTLAYGADMTFNDTNHLVLTGRTVSDGIENTVITFAESGSVTTTTPTATYSAAADTMVITVNNANDTNLSDIVTAVNNQTSEFFATATGGIYDQGVDNAVTDTVGTDEIEIDAVAAGPDFNNVQVNIVTGAALVAVPVVSWDPVTRVIEIEINNAAVTTVANLETRIDADLANIFTATTTGNTGSGSLDPTQADPDASANTGTTGGRALLADLTLEIGGKGGAEVFSFQTGAAINQLTDALNLVSDATGVGASYSTGTLTIESTAYGSDAFVRANVIEEGTGGLFETTLSAARATGTDIVATVNGISASGDGNTFSLNTSMLDLTITVSGGSSTAFNFNITGGGALFQLGPDVVTTQQARLGISSVNTASLKGETGRLYELASGGTADLETDTTTAAKIVDEVIDKVTSLRGRLGAFQKTTVDTNIAVLEDTLENLTDAESQIRDADFAAESASLTRAQILVQSGVSVLAIANSNPQNVLALLR